MIDKIVRNSFIVACIGYTIYNIRLMLDDLKEYKFLSMTNKLWEEDTKYKLDCIREMREGYKNGQKIAIEALGPQTESEDL